MDEHVHHMLDVVVQKLHQHVVMDHGIRHRDHIHIHLMVVNHVQQVDDVVHRTMDRHVRHIVQIHQIHVVRTRGHHHVLTEAGVHHRIVTQVVVNLPLDTSVKYLV